MTAIAQPQSEAPQKLLTYEAYLAEFMNERPTLQPYAIIEGERIYMNSPLLIHQIIQLNIGELFRRYQRASGRGITVTAPFDVLIRRNPRLQVRQPDVLFITNARLEQAGGVMMEGPLEAPPELVVEILSPSETRRTIQDKIEDFRSIGVEECWLASSQEESVQILRLQPQVMDAAVYTYGKTLQSFVFPDLTLKLADIFAF